MQQMKDKEKDALISSLQNGKDFSSQKSHLLDFTVAFFVS